MSEKLCTKCNTIKDISKFNLRIKSKPGVRSWCKECESKNGIKYYQNPENHDRICKRQAEYNQKPENRDRIRKYNVEYRIEYNQKPENLKRLWANSSISGHRRKGYEINITTDELEAMAKNTTSCKYCGQHLNYNRGDKNGKPQSSSPTLDSINNIKSLSIDNVQIICMRCNVTKSDRTHAEFVEYCKTIAKNEELWS